MACVFDYWRGRVVWVCCGFGLFDLVFDAGGDLCDLAV